MSKPGEEVLVFMTAYDMYELPDGAWKQALMEGVEAYNKENGTNYDPHDTWLAYVAWDGK